MIKNILRTDQTETVTIRSNKHDLIIPNILRENHDAAFIFSVLVLSSVDSKI